MIFFLISFHNVEMEEHAYKPLKVLKTQLFFLFIKKKKNGNSLCNELVQDLGKMIPVILTLSEYVSSHDSLVARWILSLNN